MKKYLFIGLFVALVIVFGVIIAFQAVPATQSNSSGPQVAKDKIMYFWRPTCEYCQKEEPIIDELAKEGIPFQKMDISAHPEYVSEYQIEGTPTFIIKNINNRLTGYQDKDTIIKFWNDNK